MITLRMIAIAAALLLGVPLLVAALPNDLEPDLDGGTLVNENLNATARVVDVVLLDLPRPVDGREGEFKEEQLVEGHTVFVTLDIEVRLNMTNGTVNVTGFVECENYLDVETGQPIPFPRRIDRAGVECRQGERVIATPDPFFDPNNVQNSGLVATGRLIPFRAPMGEFGFAEEYVFTTVRVNDWGDETTGTYYAYATPVLEPWLHVDGRPKSFVAPLPGDRLAQMGVGDFTLLMEDDPRLFFAS